MKNPGFMQGIHIAIHRPVDSTLTPRPAVFLDRDGVIVEEVNYLHRVEDIRYIPGSLEAIARLNAAGWAIVVVTNQAGVGRGYYGWPEYEAVQSAIVDQLRLVGGWFDAVWACGFHPDGKGELACEHDFRKPNPGMIQDAARQLALALDQSWIVGDKPLDVLAGVRSGLAGAILVETGYGHRMRAEVEAMPRGVTAIAVQPDLAAAVAHILKLTSPATLS